MRPKVLRISTPIAKMLVGELANLDAGTADLPVTEDLPSKTDVG